MRDEAYAKCKERAAGEGGNPTIARKKNLPTKPFLEYEDKRESSYETHLGILQVVVRYYGIFLIEGIMLSKRL